MRRRVVALFAASLLAGLALIGSPSPCGACTPSGGPGETLILRLDSVRTDTSSALAGPIYSVTYATIQGVGPTFTLYMKVGELNVFGEFEK